MQVPSINIQHNYQTNKYRTFQGSVDKSVYRYLDKVCPEKAGAIAIKKEIIEKLEAFMAPLQKDTTFSIVNVPHVRAYLLPFPYRRLIVARDPVFIDDYQTFFSNKRTKTAFSLSERCTRVTDKDKLYPHDECVLKHSQEDRLAAFKEHVDAVIKFFKDKEFDVDNVLYNKGFIKRPLIEWILPKFIVRQRIERYKKLAPEFYKSHQNKDVHIYNYTLP